FAQRAAPVQLTFLGYPGSTGVPSMDWILADPVVAPKGSDDLYSERVHRLPHTVFCFAPEANYPYPKYTQAHAQRTLTFGSFNNLPKITQHTVALWSRVLQAVPQSQLLLKAPSFKDEGAIRAFKARFAAHGIAESRLVFRGPVGLADMMAEYADVDIAQRMAADRTALLKLKQGLRARLQSQPAWDIGQYTRDFEAALRCMWVALCQDKASAPP
ncbi:MAG: hypothetical protein WCK08_12380, partial [Betaproteobacteria bacterium]